MRFHVLTIFPALFPGPLAAGVVGRALEAHTISLEVHDVRDYARDPHRQVDDERDRLPSVRGSQGEEASDRLGRVRPRQEENHVLRPDRLPDLPVSMREKKFVHRVTPRR